jgi:steroid 5-alpha reductase family enzyme
MGFWNVYLLAGLITLGLMIVLWLISLVLRNSSIVDIFWGTGFVLVAWAAFLLGAEGFPPRKWLLAILVTIWGLRLSLYILARNWRKPEDFRYAKWREENGANWWWFSFFKVFLLQGVLLWIISAPLVAAQSISGPRSLGILEGLGVVLWSIGFFFEAVGDWQLSRFKADPAHRGMVMDRGVWRYTRHPNYFGDATAWWGHYLVALSAGAWWTFFSPALMTFLLVRVSGVTMLESSLREKKPAYRDYMESTSAFIPWIPRRGR